MNGRYFKRNVTTKCLICAAYIDGYYSYYLISKNSTDLTGSNGDFGSISVSSKSTSKNTYYCASMNSAWSGMYPLCINDINYTSSYFNLSKDTDKYLLDLLIDEFLEQ